MDKTFIGHLVPVKITGMMIVGKCVHVSKRFFEFLAEILALELNT